ncbi:MAG: hypothetical protein NVSMB9_08500 [Isosphaeraceae bacterium]
MTPDGKAIMTPSAGGDIRGPREFASPRPPACDTKSIYVKGLRSIAIGSKARRGTWSDLIGSVLPRPKLFDPTLQVPYKWCETESQTHLEVGGGR